MTSLITAEAVSAQTIQGKPPAPTCQSHQSVNPPGVYLLGWPKPSAAQGKPGSRERGERGEGRGEKGDRQHLVTTVPVTVSDTRGAHHGTSVTGEQEECSGISKSQQSSCFIHFFLI